MIHLDQNHPSPIPSHPNAGLVLEAPLPDQHPIPAWSAHAHTLNHPPVSSLPGTTDSSGSSTSQLPPLNTVSSPSPDNKSSERTRSPAPADAPSPTLNSTSSLTPPPDVASPTCLTTAPRIASSASLDASSVANDREGAEKASRASTPLSELSSAPDLDEQSLKEGADDSGYPPSEGSRGVDLGTNSPILPAGAKGEHFPSRAVVGGSSGLVSIPPAHSSSDSAGGLESVEAFNRESRRQANASSSSSKPDPKVVAILELNTHLLRAVMGCQLRDIPLTDPRCHQYSVRLQSNLTWLAAAADEGRKVGLGQVALPNIQPPPPLDFVSMDRISQIYAGLPVLFQKDILRRDFQSGNYAGQSALAGLKRDRSEDLPSGLAPKRRDTGDSKMAPSFPSVSVSSSSSTLNYSQFSGPHLHNPSAQPPVGSSTPGLSLNTSSSSVVAAPNTHDGSTRGRPVQARFMQQHEGSRQVSPNASFGSMSPQPGQIPMSTLPNIGPAVLQQQYQILQNPSHPMVQYLNQTVPNFSALPLAQQIQKLQTIQVAMRQQPQNRTGIQPQSSSTNGHMHSQVPLLPTSNAPAPVAPAASTNGPPSRHSPISQHPQSGPGTFPFLGQASGSGNISLNDIGTPQGSHANANHQQRQLLLMQQHLMRNSGNSTPSAAVNPQLLMGSSSVPQRFAHSTSPTHPHSPGTAVHGVARNSTPPDSHGLPPSTLQLMQKSSSQQSDDSISNLQGISSQSQGMLPYGGSALHSSSWSPGVQPSQSPFSVGLPPSASSSFTTYSGAGLSGGTTSWSSGLSVGNGVSLASQSSGISAPHLSQDSPEQVGLSDIDTMFDWGH